ncbi:sterile alpha motif domain-containing protein 9-like [Pangasianodon hypophthalmus]|uniref:sterile alpha motif domain-containing protein 9-like n=1 Tax=Pangasianodon hypophthalmus TaxID=310915 RepID=UPI000EFE0329|nr:sterile alpha motif domain-containing protein 9-like [Pangasianodon hypophthalmus]
MANYTVPSQRGGQIPLKTQDRDHLSSLDVVWANKYEGEMINPTNAMQMEFEFYKGAPPQWLNFYWAEQENSPFVKRDLYQVLQRKISETKTKRSSIAHINLFHEPGSGGSTLAMQVLWDLRKELRCAKVIDSTTDRKAIAQQVLRLFRAGGSENQNTVLLLLDNKYTSDDPSFRENLEENLCDEIKMNNITTTIPVVIILNCLRQTDLTDRTENVILSSSLSEKEQDNFKRKQSDIIQIHGNRHTQLYAFNIMLRNYDPSYVTEVCRILLPLKKKRRSRKEQLLAFLALINSYVPSSDLPHDLCQTFIERQVNKLVNLSLEQYMQPFTDFLVIFSMKEEEDRSENTRVRMVHPMIAHECLRLLAEAGVTRSDTTLKLLTELCGDDMPPCLVKTIKKLLTKRESRLQEQEKFSRVSLDQFSKLILDIKREEKTSFCVAVLKMALKKFTADPFYPQALARFYYIERKDYEKAKYWAEMAIMRDERNSFIRDTLGQVHKNCLKNLACNEEPLKNPEAYARRILHHGKKATEAFKAEEEVAVAEEAPELKEDVLINTSTIFNNRGIFGYMQVAKIIFDRLTGFHDEWAKVLTKEISPHRFLSSYGSGKCEKYKSLITSLRDEVEEKFEFFEWYLLYSKPSSHKDEPKYFRPEVDACYKKFVTQSKQNKSAFQILKERKASTFAGLLHTQDQDTELELITEQWKEIYLHSQSDANIIQNYIAANVMLSQRNGTSTALRPLGELQEMLHNLWTEQKDRRSPEFYLLVLLLFWPDEQQGRHNSLDVSECVRYMHHSFERTYKNYLRSRYLVPLFFLTEDHGLRRFIHISCLEETSTDILTKGRERAEIPKLRRVRGEVRNYKVFAVEGSEKIEVSPNHPASVRGQGKVSFYLAFNIKGPVAYNIRYEQ